MFLCGSAHSLSEVIGRVSTQFLGALSCSGANKHCRSRGTPPWIPAHCDKSSSCFASSFSKVARRVATRKRLRIWASHFPCALRKKWLVRTPPRGPCDERTGISGWRAKPPSLLSSGSEKRFVAAAVCHLRAIFWPHRAHSLFTKRSSFPGTRADVSSGSQTVTLPALIREARTPSRPSTAIVRIFLCTTTVLEVIASSREQQLRLPRRNG